jgi:hypothetical protein
MTDSEKFMQDLMAICLAKNMPISIGLASKCVVFPELGLTCATPVSSIPELGLTCATPVSSTDKYSNNSSFKVFGSVQEMALYVAYKIHQFTGGERLPDSIHNRMVMDVSGNPYVKLYFKRLVSQ